MSLIRNILLCADSYKQSHYPQYPAGFDGYFGYGEARTTGLNRDKTVFFGLQAILQEYLMESITSRDIAEAADVCKVHGVPFNMRGWRKVLDKHKGFMPVRIRAVPEGSVVPTKNALWTVESTDKELPFVGSFLETLLLRVWYPTTVATQSYLAKQVIKGALLRSADSLDGLPFKLHDFGARGVSSGESAALGGMGHLVNFQSTDTMEAIVAAKRCYGCGMAGYSIPASEHSTITSWGEAQEVDAYRNMLQVYGKKGALFACVSDSYNIFDAVSRLWGGELRDEVIASGATLVVRPDSGDPIVLLPELARRLEAAFGSTTNSKGYKVLNHVRLIQGDGIDSPETINAILNFFMAAGFSADNLAFGMGGGLLQKVNRDTFGFAMKCSAISVNGQWRDVYKNPVGDAGKASKKGRLDLRLDSAGYQTLREELVSDSALQLVYENGKMHNIQTLDEIRERAK